MLEVYMSLDGRGIRAWETDISSWKLSLALANKHYSKVHLICDSIGYDLLKDLPFTSFSTVLDDLPSFPLIWMLPKIYAYNIAASKGKPFLHLDSDVFLWESLPKKLLNSRIFAQSEDNPFSSYVYDFDVFKTKIPDIWKKYQKSSDLIIPYNMGIFGGKDTEIIKKYSQFVLDMVNDPKLEITWRTPLKNELPKNCLLEQGNLAIFLYENNIKINTLLEDLADTKNLSHKKYTHLMGGKNNPDIINNIKARVSQIPYDLKPRGVSIQKWKGLDLKHNIIE